MNSRSEKKKVLLPYVVFILIFLLSLDLWGWNKAEPLIFGLPLWVYYFLFLTLSLSPLFLIFGKYYWEDEK